MIRRLLLTGIIASFLILGCRTPSEMHRDLNKELDNLNKEAIESKEPVEPRGPLKERGDFY